MNLRLPPALLLLLLLVFLFLLLHNRRPAAPPGAERHAERGRDGERASRHSEWRPEEPGSQRPGERSERSRAYRRERGGEADPACQSLGVTCEAQYLAAWQEPEPGTCTVGSREGYPVPDPRCTPGGIDPSVTADTLRDPAWRTRCLRDCQTSEGEKHVTYSWYSLPRPRGNSGENQVCELDHLVPLELGGADGLGNIWPECGPDATTLDARYFKVKDRVENYLAEAVRDGQMPLGEAQRAIAADWPRYLPAADQYCAQGGRCGESSR